MKCEHCGGHMEETDKRCPYCNSYNENYKKPKTPTPQQSHPLPNNNANKKPEEQQGAGCLTVIAIIIVFLICVAFIKSCATSCNSTKKKYSSVEVSEYADVTATTILYSTTSNEIVTPETIFTIYANEN